MTYKVGDRVVFIWSAAPAYKGSTGVVVAVKGEEFRVEFDKDTPICKICEYSSLWCSPHWVTLEEVMLEYDPKQQGDTSDDI